MPSLAAAVLFTVTLAADPGEGPADPSAASSAPRAEGRVSGVVKDVSGSRIRGAEVEATCGSVRRRALTRDDGGYALSLPEGACSIVVTAAGFRTDSRSVTAVSGIEARADFELAVAPVEDRVTVTSPPRYAVRDSAVATKTETPLLEIPQAVSVVDRQLLDDRGTQRLDEALQNVSGVSVGGYYQDWDYYRIRGFDAAFTTHTDGLRGSNGGMGEEIFGLDRVEVLKGPTSMLYGYGTPGGLVNVVTKRPRQDAFGELELTASSWDGYQPTLDAGGSFDDAKTVYGRLSALYQTSDSFVDFENRERFFVAPALTWDVDASTKFTLLTRYRRDEDQLGMPLPAQGTVLPNVNGEIPVSLFVGEPGRSNGNVEWNAQGGYQFTHQFSSDLSVNQNFRATWYHTDNERILYPLQLGDDERTLSMYPYTYHSDWNDFDVDTSATWRTRTGSVDHEVLVGVEYFRDHLTFDDRTITFEDPSQFMTLDVFAPVYDAVFPAMDSTFAGETTSDTVGVYVQDQARLSSRWTATVGGRFDQASSSDETGETSDAHHFSPRLGTTFQIAAGAAAYASYSQSFNPQTGREYVAEGSAGALLPPETATQWEAGVKAALPSGALTGTLSFFRLTRNDVATPDPRHPEFSVTTGAQRSQGVELEAAWRILPGWNLTAAYAYTDAVVTEDNDIPVGTPTQGAPRNTFSGWMGYQLRSGALSGLGFGVGGRYYSSQSGDLYDTFQLPAYGLLDASVSYRLGRVSLQLNVNNVADLRYFVGSYDSLYVLPGAPRNVRVRVGWAF